VPILVNRHQDADQVVVHARQNNYEGQNNIENIVEALLAQNGFNMGLHGQILYRLYPNMC